MDLQDADREEIVELLYSGQKITAIKVYREATGSGLKESKDFIEALAQQLREENPDRVMPQKGGGCGAAVLMFVTGAGLLGWWLA